MKPTKSEFLEKVREKIVSYKGLETVYEDIYVCLDSDPEQVILITGETGVGKELVAKAIHTHGDRADKPFVAVDCGRTEKELLGSKLFGHVRGAFTGAYRNRIGGFEQANGGVLFLDEIGNLSLEAQAMFLRVLEDKKVVKLGDDEANFKKVDVKIVAATNKDLLPKIKDHDFRKDLYYRLKGFPITVPPLQERPLDIPVLVRFFIEEQNKKPGKKINSLDFHLFFFCICHNWPGNVRELEGFIKFCYAMCESGKAMRLSDGEKFFSDEKIPREVTGGQLDISMPIFLVVGPLGHAVKYDRVELQKLVNFEMKKTPKGLCELAGCPEEYVDYEEIKLEDIPSHSELSYKMRYGTVPPIDKEMFYWKVRSGAELNQDEKKYSHYLEILEKEDSYRKRVWGLRRFYDRNLRSLASRHGSKVPPKKNDLVSLPYEKAMLEFEKEWIKRAGERHKGNKTKIAKEMGRSTTTLYSKLKEFGL